MAVLPSRVLVVLLVLWFTGTIWLTYTAACEPDDPVSHGGCFPGSTVGTSMSTSESEARCPHPGWPLACGEAALVCDGSCCSVGARWSLFVAPSPRAAARPQSRWQVVVSSVTFTLESPWSPYVSPTTVTLESL